MQFRLCPLSVNGKGETRDLENDAKPEWPENIPNSNNLKSNVETEQTDDGQKNVRLRQCQNGNRHDDGPERHWQIRPDEPHRPASLSEAQTT